MSLNALRKLADTITNKTNGANNEAATKQTLICPFLSALGYDVDNSGVLSPEYSVVGHSGNKKKIDYVLHADGKPNLVIECKPRSHSLNEKDLEQLDEYFGASKARFGLLTNGVEYRFFTDDTEQEGKMDRTPFLTVDLADDMKAGFREVYRLFAQDRFNEAKALQQVPHVRDCMITDKERTGVSIIRALLQDRVDPMRITPINTRRYCNIVLDHTTRKRICLLWFTKQRKPMRLSVFGTGTQQNIDIRSLDDLHQHTKAFVAMIDRHEGTR